MNSFLAAIKQHQLDQNVDPYVVTTPAARRADACDADIMRRMVGWTKGRESRAALASWGLDEIISPPSDFRVVNHGSVSILYQDSEAAQAWVAEHIPDDAQMWGRNGIVVEPRYIDDIVAGIVDSGLTVN